MTKTPDTTSMHIAMLGSYMPGDWALGEHLGAMQDVLNISRAVDKSARTGEIVAIDWGH